MKFVRVKQIGKVCLKYSRRSREGVLINSAAPIENELYRRFKANPNYGQLPEIRRFKSSAEEYHLSPARHNLLKWYPFNPEGKALEVGSRCGALTGLLCDKLKKVIALEYSDKSALVAAQRHSEHSNLEVIVGGLQDFECEERFDYIIVIGMLEYAGLFYEGKNPYESFLTRLRSMLNPNGELILAIENKIGLKYICGAPEGHTGRIFDSVHSYAYSNKVRTFSKKELTDLFHTAGYQSLSWYYPLPDHKLPIEVLSDEIIHGELDFIWSLFPTRIIAHYRREILSERRFGKTLAKAGLLDEFANSFLVIAKEQDGPEDPCCLRFKSACMSRKSELRTNVQIWKKGADKWVLKVADNRNSLPFVEEIVKRETLAKECFGNAAEVVSASLDGPVLCYPYLNFPTLTRLISSAITKGDRDYGVSLVKRYIEFLQGLSCVTCIPREFMEEFGISTYEAEKAMTCLRYGLLDCIPRNIMVDGQKWYIIDNEWTCDFPVPLDLLIYRGIVSLVSDIQDQIQAQVSETQPLVLFSGYGRNRLYLPLSWLDLIRGFDISLNQLARWSAKFQNEVVLCQQRPIRIRLKREPKVYSHLKNGDIRSGFECLRKMLMIPAKVIRRLRELADRWCKY
jgi:2-polyprenyl-3-methyl-5-hydroxy-6-metoxy-1,4-benzoquinol methylase